MIPKFIFISNYLLFGCKSKHFFLNNNIFRRKKINELQVVFTIH